MWHDRCRGVYNALAMVSRVKNNHDQIVGLCKRFGVKRLEVFGSAARNTDYDPASSDVDFFYVMDREDSLDLADRYFGFCEELEKVLGQRVDMISLLDAKNPYFLEVANRDRTLLYAA